MIAALTKLNARWKAEGRFDTLEIGVGINTGPMIAGNIGSEAIMSYTVIGDAVNLGSRLESLNKEYGTRIIISNATRERLTGAYQCRPLGDVMVKGKTRTGRDFRAHRARDRARTRDNGMKQSIIIVAMLALAAPAHAQFGGLGNVLKKAQDAKTKVDSLERHRGRGAEDRRGRQRQDPPAVRRRAGRGGPQVRHARRHCARAAVRAAEPALALHRARYRRRQRVRLARRHRSHHARRARPDSQRGGAGRRARRTKSATSRTSTR